MTPHKHAAVIKAWADGAEIEVRRTSDRTWKPYLDTLPMWWDAHEYRVKPQKKTFWFNVYAGGVGSYWLGQHLTRAEADRCAAKHRIACIEVSYTEGEGLESEQTQDNCHCSG